MFRFLVIAMFFASDDEGPRPVQPGSLRGRQPVVPLPSDVAFLQQSCSCKRLTCLRQFLDMGEAVRAKRQEFKDLPDHKKARVVESDRILIFICFLFHSHICDKGHSN